MRYIGTEASSHNAMPSRTIGGIKFLKIQYNLISIKLYPDSFLWELNICISTNLTQKCLII